MGGPNINRAGARAQMTRQAMDCPDELPGKSRGSRQLRPRADGKFLAVGGERLLVRGVTYGTFRPDAAGNEFPPPETVDRDFQLMASQGINSVRTYTVPPLRMLDSAERHGLRVLIGLGAERYAGYLCEGRGIPNAEDWLLPRVRACAGHPAV